MLRSGLIVLVVFLFGLGLHQAAEGGEAGRQEAGGAPALRVLILTGQNNHDCAFTSRLVQTFLAGTGRFRVDLSDDPAKALADAAALADYDCFFLDYNGPRWGEVAEKNFLAAVRGGTGVVVMHAANNAFPGWVDYETMVGHLWRKGTGHGRFHRFDVEVDDANHPVTWGLPTLKAHPDELYHRLLHMHEAPFRQLMSAQSTKESGGTGKREPMVTVLQFGEGRIFHTPLGHVWRGNEDSRRSLRDPQLQCLLARGTEWAACGYVTFDPEDFGLVSPLRALVAAPTHRVEPPRRGGPDEIRVSLADGLALQFSRRAGALSAVAARGGFVGEQAALAWTLVRGEKPIVLSVKSFTVLGRDDDAGRRAGWPRTRAVLEGAGRRFVVTETLRLLPRSGAVSVARDLEVEGKLESGESLRLSAPGAKPSPFRLDLIDARQGAALDLSLKVGL